MKKFLLLFGFQFSVCAMSAQVCLPVMITSGPNAFGTGGGIETYHQSSLSYNSDLNAVLWVHRSSPFWNFPGYNSGSVQATWIDLASGMKDSSILYRDSSGASSHGARYPSGVFYNPPGNTNIANAYLVGTGPYIDYGTNAWSGFWYSTRQLTGTSADQTLPGLNQIYAPSYSPVFLNYDMQQVGTKVFVGAEMKDFNMSASTSGNVYGGAIMKCDFSTGGPVWSMDSINPPYYVGPNGYANDGYGGRIAFDPSGTIGYWVAQGRLTTDYNNSADSMFAPIVYKSVDGGNTWALVLAGFDWSTAHPELKKNIGYVYSANGMRHFKVNPKHGYDVTVDSLGVLHLVTSLSSIYMDGAQKDSMIFSYTYEHDYINHHPVIWDLMTDGSTWNTLFVDSIRTAYVGADPSVDTSAAFNPWSISGTYMAYGSRIQVSRSVTGGKIFYSWEDSDPTVTGTLYNTQPDHYLKSYDISNQKVTPSVNTTNGVAMCFFHLVSDISYYDNTNANWITPMMYTAGNVQVTAGVYDGNSSVSYLYSNCGISASSYTNAAIVNQSINPCTPTVNFIMHQDSLNPQPGIWLVSAYYSSNVVSALWNWGDGTASTGLAPTHTYAAPGNYNICVTAYSMCGDSASACQNDSLYKSAQNSTISVTVLNENQVGVKNIEASGSALSIYPNPTTGIITLQQSNGIAAIQSSITVTNTLGEIVYAGVMKNGQGLSRQIDFSNLSNGTYFMRIVAGDKTLNEKFIISR